MRVLFITERLGSSVQKGTTILAETALKRGYKVFECLPTAVSLLDGKIIAKCHEYKTKESAKKNLVENFDVIHFRSNPPVDMAYMTTLYLLQLIEDKVLIINQPSAIINFPEKIFPHHFAKFSPPTLITADTELAQNFILKYKEVVAKPLYSSGGRGVVKISASDKRTAKIVRGKNKFVFQKFLPEVINGDKRVFFVGRKMVGAFLRRPQKGSIISNMVAGGEIMPTTLTAKETKLCKTLGVSLAQHKILLCGIDIIGGYVTEINITSPIGFSQISTFYNIDVEGMIWDKVESTLKIAI